MLHIYTCREDIDKQRFLFARIQRQDLEAEKKRRIFLLVPDQFTLETERSAFTYMDVSAFINPVILSMNRLAGKVLSEAGESTDHIDRYGKYMLLARLLYRNKSRLELFRNLENSTAFISQLSEAIMSLKSHMITPEKLFECASAAENDSVGGELLGKKLHDIAELYSMYEEMLADGLPDSTDITQRATEKIPTSKMLKDSIVWIFGFDYFSPLHQKAIIAMAAEALEVNVILTAEPGNTFFTITNEMSEALTEAADEAGVKTEIVSISKDAEIRGIDCRYLPDDEKPPEIKHIEETLFSGPLRTYTGENNDVLHFSVAADHYSEAQAVAQKIIQLVSEKDFRWRDILVICNDQVKRAAAIKRVFDDFGIETFLDKRHDAGYNPVLAYITSLTEIVSGGKRAEDIMRWVGSGLTDIAGEDAEELENHLTKYGFRDYKATEQVSNTIRYIREMIARFEEKFGTRRGGTKNKEPVSAFARTEGLRKFLEEDARLHEKVEAYADRLEEEGFLEYAANMRSIWDVALQIFEQIKAAIGDLETSAEEYATILNVGFSSVMMGVLPASSDAVTIGTMQRTRTGRIKAMFVLGANDGELPMFAEEVGLLDDVERETLEELGFTAFRREENLHNEEQLAIYKNLSKPSHLLYLSYTAFGEGGKEETKPSRVFERLCALFPDIPLEKEMPPDNHGFAKARTVLAPIGADRMKTLLPSVLSPTAVEKYSRCPFSFLMDRGLKLSEIRKHEIDSRGIGDVYHEVLKRFGERMNEKGGASANEDSAWNHVTQEEVGEIVDSVFGELKGGAENISEEGALLFEKDDPVAVYRLNRLNSIAKDVCWVLTKNAKENVTERMIFETDFGKGGEFGMIDTGEDGLKIAGRIDRIDVLPGGNAKVLDYKSGYEKWNSENIRNGWQLQLMLYLKAIEKTYDPVGASYFRIFEPSIDISDKVEEEISELRMDLYRNDGIALSDNEEDSKKKTKSGERLLSREDFKALRADAEKRLAEISKGLASGETPAEPKQKAGGEHVTACTYCKYLSICNYESI